MDLGLSGRTIIVSGGGSGIGEAITRACLTEGAHVAVVGRKTDHVLSVEEELVRAGAPCAFFFAELDTAEACRRMVEQTQQRFGPIYGLVNNAGYNDSLSLEATSPDAFLQGVRSNLLHYFALAHFALPSLKAERGAIVNISSKVATTGQGGTSAYAAAKGAQLALTREWACELLPAGVRVNAVLPAEVMTPLYEHWLNTFPDPAEKLGRITSRIPMEHRMTRPEEIAAAVVFLLSPTHSAHTTGQHVFVDGGYTHLDRALT